MDKYVEIIKLLEKIFGKSAVSKSLGTRTNVIRFPKGKQPLDPTTRHFDVEGSAEKNPDLVNTIKNSIEDRMGDLTKMNDQELLTYKQNLQRLDNYLNPPTGPTADVIEAGSKQRVTGEGLEKLIEEKGTKYPPTTVAGQLEVQGKRLAKLAEEMNPENIAKKEAERRAIIERQYEGKGYAGGVFGPSGMYRAVARNFLLDEAAKGKIKLDPGTIKNLQERNYISGGQPLMYADPIRIMRYHYGDDVFEKIPLDKMPTGAPSEIREVMSKVNPSPIKIEAPKTPGGYLTPGEYRANIEEMQNIEDAIKRRESRFADMTREEIQNELEQYGSRRSAFEMGFESDYPEEYTKYKTPKKPEPEEKADGGSIGLDYLMGFDNRPKYAGGGDVKKILDLIAKVNKELKGKRSMEKVNPKTGEVTSPTQSVMTADDLKTKHKDAFTAHDQIFIDINDKTAPDMIAEAMAEMKGKDYSSLSQREQLNYYKKALAYVDDIRMTKRNMTKMSEQDLEKEMNRVLNQYDKSMFIKNEQGLVDVTNQENQKMMAELLKRDHPEIYKQIYNLGEDLSQKQILSEFDTTGRKPNKDGGLNHLLGF